MKVVIPHCFPLLSSVSVAAKAILSVITLRTIGTYMQYTSILKTMAVLCDWMRRWCRRRLELYFLCLYWCLVRYILCHIYLSHREIWDSSLFAAGHKTTYSAHANDHNIERTLPSRYTVDHIFIMCEIWVTHRQIQIYVYKNPLVFYWIYTTTWLWKLAFFVKPEKWGKYFRTSSYTQPHVKRSEFCFLVLVASG